MSLRRNAVTKVGVSKALQLVGHCLNAAAQRPINNELLLISTKGNDDVQEILAFICVGPCSGKRTIKKSVFICGLKYLCVLCVSVASI